MAILATSVRQGSAALLQFPLNWSACTLKIVRAHGEAFREPLDFETEHEGESVASQSASVIE
jgi:hypothetical protein